MILDDGLGQRARSRALDRLQLQLFETVSREGNLRDVVAAYDLLAARPHVDPAAIAVIGSSYGGYLGAILTTLRPVKWLALRAPALYIDSGWATPKLQLHQSQDLRAYRLRQVAASDNRALGACRAFENDVLPIESQLDPIVPQAVLSSYRDACTQARSLTYRCIDGADHGLTSEACQRAYTKLLVNWLSEMLLGARASRDALPAQPAVADAVAPETAPTELQSTAAHVA